MDYLPNYIMHVLESDRARAASNVGPRFKAIVAELYSEGLSYQEVLRAEKRQYVIAALQQVRGNACKAAREMSLHRNTFSRLIAELGIRAKDYRPMGRRSHNAS